MAKLTMAGADLLNDNADDQPTVFVKKTRGGFEVAFSHGEQWSRNDVDRLHVAMIRQMRVDRTNLIAEAEKQKAPKARELETAPPDEGQEIIDDQVVAK